ncbi:hypothetical protein EMIT047CA2_230004 [Pseudomonas soli]
MTAVTRRRRSSSPSSWSARGTTGASSDSRPAKLNAAHKKALFRNGSGLCHKYLRQAKIEKVSYTIQ